jgi:hypothetical protein
MSFTLEVNQLIQRYLKEVHSREISMQDLYTKPNHEITWMWWTALAHFKMNDFYQRTEDVPEGTPNYTIMNGMAKTTHHYINGDRSIQVMTRAECKSIYGN